MADPDKPAQPLTEYARRESPEERRRRFAKAITRAEFGRFYWDDALEREARTGSGGPARKTGGRKPPAG
jgi:hypothetical protein